MRRDHEEALALVEKDMKRRNRVPKYVAAVLDTARRFFATVPRRGLPRIERSEVEKFIAARVATKQAQAAA